MLEFKGDGVGVGVMVFFTLFIIENESLPKVGEPFDSELYLGQQCIHSHR